MNGDHLLWTWKDKHLFCPSLKCIYKDCDVYVAFWDKINKDHPMTDWTCKSTVDFLPRKHKCLQNCLSAVWFLSIFLFFFIKRPVLVLCLGKEIESQRWSQHTGFSVQSFAWYFWYQLQDSYLLPTRYFRHHSFINPNQILNSKGIWEYSSTKGHKAAASFISSKYNISGLGLYLVVGH